MQRAPGNHSRLRAEWVSVATCTIFCDDSRRLLLFSPFRKCGGGQGEFSARQEKAEARDAMQQTAKHQIAMHQEVYE
jgi:hypothetical protein